MPKRISKRSREELLFILRDDYYAFMCRYGTVNEIVHTPGKSLTTEYFDYIYPIIKRRKFPPCDVVRILIYLPDIHMLKPFKSNYFNDFHMRYGKAIRKHSYSIKLEKRSCDG